MKYLASNAPWPDYPNGIWILAQETFERLTNAGYAFLFKKLIKRSDLEPRRGIGLSRTLKLGATAEEVA